MIPLTLSLILSLGLFCLLAGVFQPSRKSLAGRLSTFSPNSPFHRPDFEQIQAKFLAKFKSKSKMRAALFELPEILELLAVALSAGDGVFTALARVTPRANGVLPTELKRVFIALELGGDLEQELGQLARRLPQRQVVEFAAKLQLALRRGSPLSQMLRFQAASARAEIKNSLLREAGRDETRMLIPLVFLILPVTVLFAVYPSLQLLSIEYL